MLITRPLYFWLFSLPAGHVTTVSVVLPSALAAAVMVGITEIVSDGSIVHRD